MIRQRQCRRATGGDLAQPTTQQDVIELPIGLVEGEGEVPSQLPVAGDPSWETVGHVEVTHQDHRSVQRSKITTNPPQLVPPPSRYIGQVGVGDDDPTRRSPEPPDHRSSRLLLHDDHFPGGAQIQRDRGRDSWQSENLPGVGRITREQGDPVRRHPGQVIFRCRHPGSSGRAREGGGESVGYSTHGLRGNGGQVGQVGARLVPVDLL